MGQRPQVLDAGLPVGRTTAQSLLQAGQPQSCCTPCARNVTQRSSHAPNATLLATLPTRCTGTCRRHSTRLVCRTGTTCLQRVPVLSVGLNRANSHGSAFGAALGWAELSPAPSVPSSRARCTPGARAARRCKWHAVVSRLFEPPVEEPALRAGSRLLQVVDCALDLYVGPHPPTDRKSSPCPTGGRCVSCLVCAAREPMPLARAREVVEDDFITKTCRLPI